MVTGPGREGRARRGKGDADADGAEKGRARVGGQLVKSGRGEGKE